MLEISDTFEIRNSWLQLYEKVVRNYEEQHVRILREVEVGDHKDSKNEEDSFLYPILRQNRPKNPILNILVDAFAIKLRELEEMTEIRKQKETASPVEAVNEMRAAAAPAPEDVTNEGDPVQGSLGLEESFQDEEVTDMESESDDDAFFDSLTTSPSVFDLKTPDRGRGRTEKKKLLELRPDKTEMLQQTASTIKTKEETASKIGHLTKDSKVCREQRIPENGRVAQIKMEPRETPVPRSPEVIVLSSGNNSENLCEPNNDGPKERLQRQKNLKKIIKENDTDDDGDSEDSLDAFESTFPESSWTTSRFEKSTRCQQKSPWYEPNKLKESGSRKTQGSLSQQQPVKKTSSSSSLAAAAAPKAMKQMKLHELTRKLPVKTVDVSILKGCKEKANNQFNDDDDFSAAATSKNGVKRKSDEKVEGVDKREKVEEESFSQTFYELSPIKQSENKDPSSPLPFIPASPVPGPSSSTSRNGRVKTDNRIKPLSPENGKKERNGENIKNNNEKAHDSFTVNLIKEFDKFPKKDEAEPNFRYKEPVVRKKNERAHLQGWDCEECKEYYEALESQMAEKEIQRIKDKCSRHRAKHAPAQNTPNQFWCTYFPETEELYKDGFINVATPFIPQARETRRRDSDTDSELENMYEDEG